MAKLKGKLGCTLNLTIRYCTPSAQPDMSKIDRKLWISDVVTPQSCPRKWGKWTERICEETSFLYWFFLKLGRRAHHDRFFPTFGIILAQTSLRQQLFKVSNIRNGIHWINWNKNVWQNEHSLISTEEKCIIVHSLILGLQTFSDFFSIMTFCGETVLCNL